MSVDGYSDFDRDIWDEELEDYVPAEILDAHVHLWSEAHKGELTGPPTGLRLELGYAGLADWCAKLFPGRRIHFLALGTPLPGMDVAAHNRWLADQAAQDPESAASMVVTPASDPDEVAEQVVRLGFVGLKPYRSFAPDLTNARIADFLPDRLVEVADHFGLAVTLHLSRKDGAADPVNQQDLARLTARYPRVQWILAHCARGFNAFMLERSLEVLRDLPNLWYDTSAVTELRSHYLLMQREDRRRVAFGSDDVVAGCARGKYITYGRAWVFYPGRTELEHCDPRATLVVYEQLRQERQVAEMLGLTAAEIEAHFAGNARRLLRQVRADSRRASPAAAGRTPA
ncbi:MAG: amidohydrolase family protein [Candidatus Latescibacterota bacterium]|jgi:glutamate-1-semialdehyde 2,1-aminomutase